MFNYDCVSFSSSIVNVPYVIILSVSICISSLLVWISINTFKTSVAWMLLCYFTTFLRTTLCQFLNFAIYIYNVFYSVLKVQLEQGCETDIDECSDPNANCDRDKHKCKCTDLYYRNNSLCGKLYGSVLSFY